MNSSYELVFIYAIGFVINQYLILLISIQIFYMTRTLGSKQPLNLKWIFSLNLKPKLTTVVSLAAFLAVENIDIVSVSFLISYTLHTHKNDWVVWRDQLPSSFPHKKKLHLSCSGLQSSIKYLMSIFLRMIGNSWITALSSICDLELLVTTI
jgi:hypothetical protein